MTDLRANAVLRFVVLGAQPRQTHQLGINGRLLDDERITGGDGFDFGVSERSAINVLQAPESRVAAHDLMDELRFAFKCLPHVTIEAADGYVAVDLDYGVVVALAKDATFTLFNVGGPPR